MYVWQIVSRKVVLIHMLNNSTFPHNCTNTLYLRPGFFIQARHRHKKKSDVRHYFEASFGNKADCPAIRRRQWHPTPVLLPGKSHGWRSLVGCSPWGRYQSDMTERLHFDFSLSCIGEGNGNPLQCSCLENPRDGGASWAAVYGVAQSRTRPKRLSSSSSDAIVMGDIDINGFYLPN